MNFQLPTKKRAQSGNTGTYVCTGPAGATPELPLWAALQVHSFTLVPPMPWREEPGRLQSMGTQRVRHDLAAKQQQALCRFVSQTLRQTISWRSLWFFQNGEIFFYHKRKTRTSLVVQWLRICLPMQGTQVQQLVWEDSTCRGTTKPKTIEPTFYSPRSEKREATTERGPRTATRESSLTAMRIPHSPKYINFFKKGKTKTKPRDLRFKKGTNLFLYI